MDKHIYLCIDLKSFFASVECVERGLDPMTTDLVVADPDRSKKTICLAVTPSLKQKGVKNRCRIFEIPTDMEYIIAPPRMQKYIDYAANIYGIYIRYIAPEDIHVYSIDEAFLDITRYLKPMGLTPKQMAIFLMDKIYEELGIRATAGIGTNLYLAKIALDITAKHSPNFIGILDEERYKRLLWDHKPITDFWRIGNGTARRLARMGIYTMRGITEANEDLLYKEFGIDAELLIDHAYGKEPTTMKDIHSYRPRSTSLSNSQILMRNYSFDEARIIVKEMADNICLKMLKNKVATDSVTIIIGYSRELNIKAAKGTAKLTKPTNSDKIIIPSVLRVYERIVDRDLPIRQVSICCNRITEDKKEAQISIFDMQSEKNLEKSKAIQSAVIRIKERFGKNAIVKALDLDEAATAMERNRQIGGHKSG